MNLRRRQVRPLRGIERDLADSDPALDTLFLSFARLAAGREIPPTEKIGRWPGRMLVRLRRGRPRTEPTTDRCAGNWNDP